jgi:hypothetical protein
MNFYGKALLVGLGLAASVAVSTLPAAAQYYGRGYDRYDRYDRYEGRRYGRNDIEAQKRAIRAQREAQKRAYRNGYGRGPVYGGPVGRGYSRPGDHGPTGGMAIVPGPLGGYAVPVMPDNAGRYGNPNN